MKAIIYIIYPIWKLIEYIENTTYWNVKLATYFLLILILIKLWELYQTLN